VLAWTAGASVVSSALPVYPDPATLTWVEGLADQGKYLQAWQSAREVGSLDQWRGTRAGCIAGGLARHLGAPRLSTRILVRAFRTDRRDAEAQTAYAHTVLEHRGPLAAWEALASAPPSNAVSADGRADLLLARATISALMRDFESADALVKEAAAVAPNHFALGLAKAFVLEREDQCEAALAAAREALDRHYSRGAIQQTARCLMLLDRKDEALEVLSRGADALESAHVALQLASLQISLRRFDAAEAALARFESLSPLMEPRVSDVHCAMLSDIAYRRGDIWRAIDLARRTKNALLLRMADRMQSARRGMRRRELEVPFVLQHRLTCVPATLTAISKHWEMPADHLSVAEAICNDGTPAHSERGWAEANGWSCGEFTVTWDAARTLIDAGVAFVVTTVSAAEGHAQAVVGYDELRGTWSIRDPRPEVSEVDADGFLRAFQSSGPRGMWLVPVAQASRVKGSALPDAALWDSLYRLQVALAGHRRDDARSECASLVASAPQHPVAHAARRALAAYDSNLPELRSVAETKLRYFPDDARAQLDRLAAMRELAARHERIACLDAATKRKGADPIFCEQLGSELLQDARDHARAARLLRRAMRARPHRASPLALLAEIAWRQRRFEDGLALLRFAACLEDTNEDYARAYFKACRMRGQTPRALELLQTRCERLGSRSAFPIQTLHAALDALGRSTDAADVLQAALARRPGDGDLLLYAARVSASHGKLASAKDLLARADGHVAKTHWLRAAAELAHLSGDVRSRAQFLKRLLDVEPLAIDAHAGLVGALTADLGREAAIDHLRSAIARYPENRPLLRLFASVHARSSPEVREAAIRQVISTDPHDAWARGELSLALADRGLTAEALAACEEARSIDPSDPALQRALAYVLKKADRGEEARAALHDAVRASADCSPAIRDLLGSSRDPLVRASDLAFVEENLLESAVDGAGVLVWYERLRTEQSSDEVLQRVVRLREARPELWTAWSVEIRQRAGMQGLTEAHALATQASERFPLVAEVWTDLADVAQAAGDSIGELHALEQAVSVAPLDPRAVARLSELLETGGHIDRAQAVLQRAVSAAPGNVELTLRLAKVLWRAGDQDRAVECIRRTILLDPESPDAYEELYAREAARGRAEEALAYARGIVREHAWSSMAACGLAMVEKSCGNQKEALGALDRAIAIDPRLVSAHDRRAVILAQAGEFDQALAACRPKALAQALPIELQGRSAWLRLQNGDAAGAAIEMRALLSNEPGYYWGWVLLVEACTSLGEVVEQTAAAHRLVQILPEHAQGHQLLGDALRASGDLDGAAASWRRASALETIRELIELGAAPRMCS
jgi:tetratricopeptide (TPR) repeat protein